MRRPVTEQEAADRLERERQEDPLYRGPSFETISAAGPNSALAHYRVTPESNRTLEAGSLYLVDSGGQYLDATTDVTRTIAIGEASAEMRRRFTLVLKGHIAVARALFPHGRQRRPARRPRAAAALAGRARVRPRHRAWHRQLSVRARGAGPDRQDRRPWRSSPA